MKYIKIGIRKNLLYPFMFMLFIFLQRIVREILELNYEEIVPFLLGILNFFSYLIFGSILNYFFNKSNKSNENNKILGVELIHNEKEIRRIDSNYKIIILLFFDSFFDFIGTFRRKYSKIKIGNIECSGINMRLRGREILFATFIYYYTIGDKLYRHHIFSLIIIIFCLIIVVINEILENKFTPKQNLEPDKLIIYLIIISMISICRTFSDTIEKYLFEYDYLDPFKLLRSKGFIEVLLGLILLFFESSQTEIKNLFNFEQTKYDKLPIFILLVIAYFILGGFKNVYKTLTVKAYSPMTRALFDSMLDIFLIIYEPIKKNLKEKSELDLKEILTVYFWINIIVTIITIFSSLVFNEFLVLYFCDLEKNAYLEIMKRGSSIELVDTTNPINENEFQRISEL